MPSKLIQQLQLGTWQCANWTGCEVADFRRVIQRALEIGIRSFDTAPIYGKGLAERVLGEELAGITDVCISSKFSHHFSRPDLMRKSLDSSLRNLKRDSLSGFMQHWPQVKKPPLQETIEELTRIRKDGLCSNIGVSNWGPEEFAEVSPELLAELDFIQMPLHLLWPTTYESCKDLCSRYGINIHAYSPLAQGLLARTWHKEDLAQLPDRDPRRQLMFLCGSHLDHTLTALQQFYEFSQNVQIPPMHLALEWSRNQSGVTELVIGASSAEQLEPLLQQIDLPLNTYEQLATIFKQVPTIAAKSQWGWHPRNESVS